MAKLWDIISPLSKVNLARVYKNLTGLDFMPPKDDERKIHLEGQIENLEEIDKLMQQAGQGVWHE